MNDGVVVVYGQITIPLCGTLTTISGTFRKTTTTYAASGTAQITSCNGVKSVKITSLTITTSS